MDKWIFIRCGLEIISVNILLFLFLELSIVFIIKEWSMSWVVNWWWVIVGFVVLGRGLYGVWGREYMD